MRRSPLASTTSRRGLLTGGGALGLAALLAACGSKDEAPSAGAWSFTDDRGQTVSLAAAPERIVAFVGVAAALHDLGLADRIVGVFGPTVGLDGAKDVQAGDLDVSRVTVLGNAWGEFSIEKFAELDPDLLISNMFEEDTLWYVPDDSADKILGLVPSAGVKTFGASLRIPIDRLAGLAATDRKSVV